MVVQVQDVPANFSRTSGSYQAGALGKAGLKAPKDSSGISRLYLVEYDVNGDALKGPQSIVSASMLYRTTRDAVISARDNAKGCSKGSKLETPPRGIFQGGEENLCKTVRVFRGHQIVLYEFLWRHGPVVSLVVVGGFGEAAVEEQLTLSLSSVQESRTVVASESMIVAGESSGKGSTKPTTTPSLAA